MFLGAKLFLIPSAEGDLIPASLKAFACSWLNGFALEALRYKAQKTDIAPEPFFPFALFIASQTFLETPGYV